MDLKIFMEVHLENSQLDLISILTTDISLTLAPEVKYLKEAKAKEDGMLPQYISRWLTTKHRDQGLQLEERSCTRDDAGN